MPGIVRETLLLTTSGGGGGGGNGAIEDGANPVILASVKSYPNSNPLTVIAVDTNGDPASFGGATQYARDTVAGAADLLMMAGVVRRDARGTLVGTDGDRTLPQVNASGDVRVDGSGVTQPISAAALPLPAGAATSALQTQPGVDIGDVTINNGAGAAAVNIQDGGNSITVDGPVTDAQLRATPVPVSLTSNQTVDITKINGTATAVNSGVKDNGTIRVVIATDQPALTSKLLVTPDSVALPANQSVNLSQVAGTTTDTNSGNKSAGTVRVVLATDQPALTNKLLVTPDSVALPANQSVNVNQLAGTAVDVNSGNKGNGTQRVVLATDNITPTNPFHVDGAAAQDAAISGNPVPVGLRASAAVPTDMSADGDVVYQWALRNGAIVAAVDLARHLGLTGSPFTHTFKCAQYTTTQTGVALWTPASGKKIVITSINIQVGGTTAGTLQVWFGASGDTTYTRGSDYAIFDGEFAPSATLKPGIVWTGLWISPTADYLLRVTDSAAINPLTVTVHGYEF